MSIDYIKHVGSAKYVLNFTGSHANGFQFVIIICSTSFFSFTKSITLVLGILRKGLILICKLDFREWFHDLVPNNMNVSDYDYGYGIDTCKCQLRLYINNKKYWFRVPRVPSWAFKTP